MVSKQILLATIFALGATFPAQADESGASSSSSSSSFTRSSSSSSVSKGGEGAGGSSSSSSEVVEQSGVLGFQKSNKFVPKYKERISTYKDQIELGKKGGWLSADDADKFTKELAKLSELEASVSSKGYQKADVDDIDKQFTKFNMDFTAAANKKQAQPAPAASSTTPAAAPKSDASGQKTTTNSTAKAPIKKAEPAKAKTPASAKPATKTPTKK